MKNECGRREREGNIELHMSNFMGTNTRHIDLESDNPDSKPKNNTL